MLNSQIEVAPRGPSAPSVDPILEVRADKLRQLFTPSEARTFGIDVSDDKEGADAAAFRPLLRGLGAVLSTVTLFVTFGFVATLGLADPGLAIAVVPATLA